MSETTKVGAFSFACEDCNDDIEGDNYHECYKCGSILCNECGNTVNNNILETICDDCYDK